MKKNFFFILPRMRLIKFKLYNSIKDNPQGILSQMSKKGIFSLQRDSVCRGLSIGMFWAFIPIPLQMVPATFFCWLGQANLPLALLAVWISNPLTYIPIFYLEYKIGLIFFDYNNSDSDFDKLTIGLSNKTLMEVLTQFINATESIILPLMIGSVVLSVSMAIVGYILGVIFCDRIKPKIRHFKVQK